MPLDVIGAGFGRTGTMSLKLALEQLGFGPCHHMVEVLMRPGAAEPWAAAARGERPDWDGVFADYRSSCDWPSCDYWRELAAHWPDAKVILTVREPETWFRSTQATIFSSANPLIENDRGPIGQTMRAIGAHHFGGKVNDRDLCLAALAQHNAAVQRELPAERLLVMDIAEGWAPLCRFLDVAVPDAPFPHANTSDEFGAHAGKLISGIQA